MQYLLAEEKQMSPLAAWENMLTVAFMQEVFILLVGGKGMLPL